MFKSSQRLVFLLVMTVAVSPADSGAKSSKIGTTEGASSAAPVLWREPADIESRNLLYGIGGEDHQPRGHLYFCRGG